MRTIKLKSLNIYEPYVLDCKRIQQILLNNSYFANLDQCYALWSEYSDSLCAGWLIMNGTSDEEIFEVLKPYFDAGDDVL